MDGQDAISLRQYFETLLKHYCDAHQKEHALMAETSAVMHAAMEARLKTMNEFRAQIMDERSTFVTQDRYDVKHEALERIVVARIEFAEKRVIELEKMVANMKGRSAAIMAAIGVGLVVFELLLRFVLV